MIVRHWMTTKVVTIRKEASIQEALAVMQQGSIRHLPVVDANNQLLGWVTDADLRGVLIASMLEELTLEDVMIRRPFAATPEMALEEAAHIILEKKIGGLPVVEEGLCLHIVVWGYTHEPLQPALSRGRGALRSGYERNVVPLRHLACRFCPGRSIASR